MRNLLTNLIISFLGRDGKTMMALLWSQEVLMQETDEEAKAVYARVPRLLKEKVKQILIDAGFEYLTE